MSAEILNKYNEFIKANSLNIDEGQINTIKIFDQFLEKIENYEKAGIFSKIFTPKPGKGIYIYGHMGSGKTMIMDMFYNFVKNPKKKRIHFHFFMQELHKLLHNLRERNEKDVILEAANLIACETDILCFDEFHLTEVVDCMILSRIFSEFFKLGVICIITSNKAPDELYKYSFGQEHFKKFANNIKENLEVVFITAKNDYRKTKIKSLKEPFITCPIGMGEKFIKDISNQLGNNDDFNVWKTEVNQRIVEIGEYRGPVFRASFNEICGGEYWAGEYIKLASNFEYILIWDIPKFTPLNLNEIKRFITLIDEIYEYRAKLICTMEENFESWDNNKGIFEWGRTISRLNEMASLEWLEKK